MSWKELEISLLLLVGVVHTAGHLSLQVHQGGLRTPANYKQIIYVKTLNSTTVDRDPLGSLIETYEPDPEAK